MSAVFYAAGPDILPGSAGEMSNIDIAPTIERILGVTPAGTVQGEAMALGPAPFALANAASRKIHGQAGPFDFRMPLTGARGVEPRPAAAGNSHQLVFTFSNPVASGSAAVTAGVGSVGSTTFSGSEMIVNLTGIANSQKITVTLTNVTDTLANTIPTASLSVGFLLGDVNRDGFVNATDTSEIKSLVTIPAPVSPVNAAGDVKLDGKLNIADSAVVKSKFGTSVAP